MEKNFYKTPEKRIIKKKDLEEETFQDTQFTKSTQCDLKRQSILAKSVSKFENKGMCTCWS
jgi:hypothetical protein